MISQMLVPVAWTFLCYAMLFIAQRVYRELTYPLRNLSGPKNPSYIFGNFKLLGSDSELTKKWRDQFGPTFLFKSLFSANYLHTSDIKALNHIITNSSVYQRPPFINKSREAMLGPGLLTVDLEDHKRQVSPPHSTFGTAQIGLLTDVFVEKAVQLRDIWTSQLAQNNGAAKRIDVYFWLRRMTLDVIGQAGFNYDFNALEETETPNELTQVFTELFHSPNTPRNAMYQLMEAIVPVLQFVPLPGRNVILNARDKMFSIAGGIVSDNIRASDGAKSFGDKKDLLSVLLKANLAKEVPASQRLSDSEVVSQIPAFFVAGHETTSTATGWALHALSIYPAIQKKLREELLTLPTENPTMDQLNSLSYLDSIVREVLRIYSPVDFLDRMAMQDDILPLSKPYIDAAGKSHDTLFIPKGQIIHLPMLAVNTDPEIWGDDAAEFKPERWEHVPDASNAIPSVWGNLFTFFAGPNNCIGFRFALVEFKALLFTLIREFEFEPAVPSDGIGCTARGLRSPIVLAEREKGTSLPLLVKACNA
ncbi:cytochrome P450 [Mycena capillaripes]|nr:cytochrome P450 [Mycena capillaripes]